RQSQDTELLLGDVASAVSSASRALEHADRSANDFLRMVMLARNGGALHAAGRRDEAQTLFDDAERRQRERQPDYPLLYSIQGHWYCDLLLDRGERIAVHERAMQTLRWATHQRLLLEIALDELSLGRAESGLLLSGH